MRNYFLYKTAFLEAADQNQSPEGILQNNVLKHFVKFIYEHLFWISFSIKLVAINWEHVFLCSWSDIHTFLEISQEITIEEVLL